MLKSDTLMDQLAEIGFAACRSMFDDFRIAHQSSEMERQCSPDSVLENYVDCELNPSKWSRNQMQKQVLPRNR